jgi:predicted dehydrogenase
MWYAVSKAGLRVAVVGLGKMGLVHASLLNTMPSIQLAALCDRNTMLLRFFGRVFKKTCVVDDIQKLSKLDLDAVYVTTPIPTHFPVAEMIYSKGIARNLFVEKTLASDYEKSKKLCSLAARSGGVNMVGYMKRFSVTFLKAKELLDKDILGEVTTFKAFAYSSDFAEISNGSRVSASRGGVLEDLGAHVIDLALMLLGDFDVEEASLHSLGERGSEDSAILEVRNSKGLKGSFHISWCMPDYRLPEFGLVITGSKGVLSANDDTLELCSTDDKSRRWYKQDLNDNVGYLLGEPEYFREDSHFVESVSRGCRTELDFTTASRVDRVIGQAKQRAEKNA